MASQIQFGADGYVLFANNATLAASSTPCIGFSMRGDFINALRTNGSGTRPIVGLVDGSGNVKAALVYWAAAGRFATMDKTTGLYAHGAEDGIFAGAGGGFDNATMYDFKWTCDPATGAKTGFYAFAQGGFNTGPGYLGGCTQNSSTPDVSISGGKVFAANFLPTGASLVGTSGMLLDWLKGGASDSAYTDFDAPLEEGSGSSVSPSGTLNGTYGWVGGADTPDEGIVTVDATPIALPGTTQARVVWKKAGAVLSPQPATSWTIVADSSAVSIDASGVVTAQAAGTATVRATSGIVVATTEIAVTNPYSFTGTIT